MIKEVVASACTCDECGHEWLARVVPARCAKCKSRRWNAGPGEAKRERRDKARFSDLTRKTGEVVEKYRNRKPVQPRKAKRATIDTTPNVAHDGKTTAPRPEPVQLKTEKKLGNCPACGAQLQPWGALKRCNKCQRNY